MPDPDRLLNVSDLSVQFRRSRREKPVVALDRVSMQLAPNETLGVVGESGSGKSTLAKAILGLVPVSGGSIKLDGNEITGLPFAAQREVYRRIQMVFQDPYSSLNPARTVGGTLTEPIESFGLAPAGGVDAWVTELLASVHLTRDAAHRYPRNFSGGQRQRIAIARALAPSPEIVICDEAVSALDLSVQAQILNLLLDLQRRSHLSYIFISHDLDVVRHMSDRIIVLYHGRVMESGRASAVWGTPAHPYTLALQQAAPGAVKRSELATIPRVTASAVAEGCPFAPRCAFAQQRCVAELPVLGGAGSDHEVACHRFPEWQSEVNDAANDGGSAPTS